MLFISRLTKFLVANSLELGAGEFPSGNPFFSFSVGMCFGLVIELTSWFGASLGFYAAVHGYRRSILRIVSEDW